MGLPLVSPRALEAPCDVEWLDEANAAALDATPSGDVGDPELRTYLTNRGRVTTPAGPRRDRESVPMRPVLAARAFKLLDRPTYVAFRAAGVTWGTARDVERGCVHLSLASNLGVAAERWAERLPLVPTVLLCVDLREYDEVFLVDGFPRLVGRPLISPSVTWSRALEWSADERGAIRLALPALSELVAAVR